VPIDAPIVPPTHPADYGQSATVYPVSRADSDTVRPSIRTLDAESLIRGIAAEPLSADTLRVPIRPTSRKDRPVPTTPDRMSLPVILALAPAPTPPVPANPNGGKRKVSRGAKSAPRLTNRRGQRGSATSTVTVLHIDPAKLKRARARGNGTPTRTLDAATVVARSVRSRSGIRKASEKITL